MKRHSFKLKVKDITVFDNMVVGDMVYPASLPHQGVLPPLEPIFPPKATPRSIRLRSANVRKSSSPPRISSVVEEAAQMLSCANADPSPRRPMTARERPTFSRHSGPLANLNSVFITGAFREFSCLWPQLQASPYAPKGYYLRFSSSGPRVLLECVDLFTGASFVGMTSWTLIGVCEERRNKYLTLVEEAFTDATIMQSSVAITKHADEKKKDHAMHVKVVLTIGGLGSTHVLMPSEEYSVDQTQFSNTSTQHVLALLVAAVSDSAKTSAIRREDAAKLREQLTSLEEKYKKTLAECTAAKEELKSLLGNISAALVFPPTVDAPLLASTKVRCVLDYVMARAGARDAEYIRFTQAALQNNSLHEYTESFSSQDFKFAFGLNPKALQRKRFVPLDQNVTVHSFHQVGPCRGPDGLRDLVLAVFNRFNLRPLFGIHEGALTSFVEFAPEFDTANFTLHAAQEFIDKGKLFKHFFPVDIMALFWSCIAYAAAPGGKEASMQFLKEHHLLTDDAIPEMEKVYFADVVHIVTDAMCPTTLLQTRSEIEMCLADPTKFDKTNFHHRMCLMKLIMVCAVFSPFSRTDRGPLVTLSRRLYESSELADGSTRVPSDSELLPFTRHVFVHMVRPMLEVLVRFEPKVLGEYMGKAEEIYQNRKNEE